VRIEQTRLGLALAFALFAASLVANAQPPTNGARIGILSDESLSQVESFDSFAQGLRDLGYVQGQNIAFERCYVSENYKVLPRLAVDRGDEVIE
jgi:putative tryptophan/tyrosine transport system substrate-binding protein